MRWVVAHPGPHFSVDDVYDGWCEALTDLGQTVIPFNLGDRLQFYSHAHFKDDDGQFIPAVAGQHLTDLAVNGLYATLYKARPDVLLVISGWFVPRSVYDLCHAYGTKVVVVHTEEPYETDRAVRIAEWADVNLINDPTNIVQFPRGTRYAHQAYRPGRHHPGPPREDYACDLAFIGTGYPSRIQFLEAMDLTGLDVLLGGNWQSVKEGDPLHGYLANEPDVCVDNAETADVYRSAQMGLNLYRRETSEGGRPDGWACGPREIEMAACGLFYLREPRSESDELFDMLPTFSSPEEASDLLRYWLARPAEREEVALKARAAIADRTFHSLAVELLRQLERE